VAEASAAVEPVAQASEPVPATPPATETPAAGLGGTEDYVVAAGDTLMKIAFQRYGDIFQWKKIASDNADHLKDPNVLPVGMKLKVEAATVASASGEGERYLIKKGDTLGSISGSVYGTPKKWKRIWENNKNLINNPDRIFSGFYLSYLFSDQDRQEKEQFQTQGAGNALGAAPAAPAAERMPASAPVTGK
jgi:nucleoid-associated protein YgaU